MQFHVFKFEFVVRTHCFDDIVITKSIYMYKMIKAKLYTKIMSVRLLIIVIIDFKCFPSTYCLMQGRNFIKV